MDKPVKVTSVQHLYHIIASSEQMREFFIALNGGRSWKTIGFSDQLDKNGEPKWEIFNGISGSRQVLTRENLEKKSLIGKAIRDGHLYLYDDNENAPKEEHLEQQSLEIAYFQENLKQWVMDNTSAVKKFIEAKSKEFEGIVFTAEDVLVHEDGLAHAIGELFAQEYSYYLPVDLVRHAECESVEQEMRCDNPGDKLYPYGPYMLTIRLWLAKNHSVEEVQQYIDTLNWDKINQTIIAIILPYVGIQKYLYLTQQKLGEIGAWTREHNQSKKRKAMEEKDQMSFNFD